MNYFVRNVRLTNRFEIYILLLECPYCSGLRGPQTRVAQRANPIKSCRMKNREDALKEKSEEQRKIVYLKEALLCFKIYVSSHGIIVV
jgi:hypothetical protein